MKQSWSIIVFCFNEAGTVEEVVGQLISIFEEHRKDLYEIIVVDDGSTDGSYEMIERAQREHPEVVRVIRHERNKGIGLTLQDGYRAAKNENISAVPADGQFDVQEFIPHLDIPARSFVSFYRKENIQYSSFRTILSAANKYVNKVLNGIELKDVNWVKIYKRESITSFPWKLTSSLIESELCAKLLLRGEKAIEILSYYHPRRSGKSKGASLPIILQALRETAKLVLIIRNFKKCRNAYID